MLRSVTVSTLILKLKTCNYHNNTISFKLCKDLHSYVKKWSSISYLKFYDDFIRAKNNDSFLELAAEASVLEASGSFRKFANYSFSYFQFLATFTWKTCKNSIANRFLRLENSIYIGIERFWAKKWSQKWVFLSPA